ncbi:MAG: peroxide stress protein YaaA [Rhodothermales bacterium]
MAGFSILLPPSDEKVSGGNSLAPKMFDRRSSHTFNYFVGLNPERRQVVESLNTLGDAVDDLAALLDVSPDNVEHAVGCNTEVMTSPLMSALDRYRPGVMYEALDFENLPTGAQRRLLEHGVIFSPLFGLLRPDDLIPEYYLSLAAELPDLGSIVDFWTPYVSKTLNDLLAGHFVWNLLPDRFGAFWDSDSRYEAHVDIEFYRKSKGKLTRIEEGVDEFRGKFVNTLVRGSADSIESLTDFEEDSPLKVVDVSWDDNGRDGKIVVVPS